MDWVADTNLHSSIDRAWYSDPDLIFTTIVECGAAFILILITLSFTTNAKRKTNDL